MKSGDLARPELLSKIRDLLAEITDDCSLELSEETMQEDVPDWDSMSHIKLIIALEKEFGVRFSTEEIGQTNTAGSLIDLLQSKTGENS